MSRNSLSHLKSEAGNDSFFPYLQKEMNRLFDQFRTGLPAPDFGSPAEARSAIVPAIDIVEKEDAVELSAEIPGVKEDDLKVTMSQDILTLQGHKAAEYEKSDDNYHLTERQYGSFRRQIPLGFVPDEDAIEAHFADGILKLHIAKPANVTTATRKIDIKKN